MCFNCYFLNLDSQLKKLNHTDLRPVLTVTNITNHQFIYVLLLILKSLLI